MIPELGKLYRYHGHVVLVQDRDNMDLTALVGIPDSDGLMLGCRWVRWDELEKVK